MQALQSPWAAMAPSGMQVSYRGPAKKTPEEIALEKELSAQTQAALEQQKQGIAQTQQAYEAAINAPQKTDLSALASLSDAWTGSKFAQTYEKPQTQQEQALLKAKLADMLQSQRQGLSDKNIEFLKGRLVSMDKAGGMYSYAPSRANMVRPLPEVSVQKITEGENAIALAEGLIPLIEEKKNLMGPTTGLGSLFPYSADQKMLVSNFDTARQVIGKLVEGGVLRKEDEAKYAKMLPVITDLPDVAKHKAAQFTEKLRKDVSRYQENLARFGYNIPPKSNETSAAFPDAPSVGFVNSKGFRYNGGDPNDGKNWTKVK